LPGSRSHARTVSSDVLGIAIETARLRLRIYRDGDLADLVALVGNWEVSRWTGSVPYPYTEAAGRDWIGRVRRAHEEGRGRSFAVALRESDRLIGSVGFDGSSGDGSDEPALGYWLGQNYWGRGYASEAVAALLEHGFRTLGLATIRAYTDPANLRSQRVLLRCGLVYAGDIELLEPTRGGARRAPLFRIARGRPPT
jgi:ribosomal-protein-alanine N-acetyltransferase